jgi:hypothetical protein
MNRTLYDQIKREAWPPNLMRLKMNQLRTESPYHPKQLALKKLHERKAKIYWEIRHAENIVLER